MVHEESRIRLSVIQLFVGSTSNIRGHEEDEEEGEGGERRAGRSMGEWRGGSNFDKHACTRFLILMSHIWGIKARPRIVFVPVSSPPHSFPPGFLLGFPV